MNELRLKIAIGIATAGRCEVLAKSIQLLKRQTRMPELLVVCPLPSDGIGDKAFDDFPAPTRVIRGPIGLCAQRNAILSAAESADLIVFFDDDFLADAGYIAKLEQIFLAHPDVVASTGHVLADGISGPGLAFEQGLEILNASRPAPASAGTLHAQYGTYGCNMAFRLAPIRANNLLFDENLPLYGWQEDIDFSTRLASFGRIVKSDELMGVHLGVKAGRTSGVRYGYSQIVNPIYLFRKGTMSSKHARRLMSRNVLANLIRSLWPEPWVDRKGRLRGNFLALVDIIKKRDSPVRILQLD
jgi:glycosyltransferase involved in cell wall biosynthesis